MTPNALQRSIHRPHAREQQTILDALSSDPAYRSRVVRMSECASHGRVYIDGDGGDVHLWVHRCGDRICPLCSKFRSRQVAKQLKDYVRRARVLRHMCLTVQTFPQGSLSAALSHLMESFRRLKRTNQWVARVRGGVYVIEVTRGKKDDRWHPHLHLLVDGEFWQQRELSAVWEDCTRGSPVVWISRAEDRHALYLAKYAGKPAEISHWPASCIREYATVMHGRRMAQTFGDAHGVKVCDSDLHPDPATVRHAMSLSSLLEHARHGMADARALVRALQLKYEWFLDYSYRFVEPLRDAWDNDHGPPADLLDAEIKHTAMLCLHYATPLPPLRQPIRLTPGCSTEQAASIKRQARLIPEPQRIGI